MKAITTKYHGQTNTKPARISASAEGVVPVYVSVNHYAEPEDAHLDAVRQLCAELQWVGTLAEGYLVPGSNVYVWINSTLTTILDVK